MIRLGDLVATARQALDAAGIAEAGLDAVWLVELATGCGRLVQMTDADRPVTAAEATRLQADLARRLAGEPVGRIAGARSFYGRSFSLGPATLEPRADTECLIDLVLRLVADGGLPGVAADGAGLDFVDIGTGSGAIAVTLLAELPAARGLATDVAAAALAVARANADQLGVGDRLRLVAGSYLEPVPGRWPLIVANPPYIATGVIASLAPEVRLFDPMLALDGGADGLVAYRALAAGALAHLVPGGVLVVEIGFDQGAVVASLLAAAGLTEIAVTADLAGCDRLVSGRAPGQNP